MCNYCDCRSFPLVRQLNQEHEEITNAAGRLRTAIVRQSPERLARFDELLALLHAHTAAEEAGLFAEVRAEGSLATTVDQLCIEHDEIHGALGGLRRTAPDWSVVLATLDRLHRHIDNEEHGLFPAAAIALPIDVWDRITPPELTSTITAASAR